jgi:hypothetical protein
VRCCLVFSLFVLSAGAADLSDEQIKVGDSTLEVSFGPGALDLPQSSIHRWIENAARAVALYYGRFPVALARLRIVPAEGRHGVSRGTTWGREYGGLTRISIGQNTTQAELDDDWMLTHELVHMSFPSVDRQQHWIEEGIATYVEPIARAQAGTLPVDRVWRDMLRDMSKGEPEEGDEGLDHTHTWGRTYWGGALFCLVAEMRIREQTHNRKGLQDALRAILAAGGNITAEWPVTKAFEIGDQATGVPVLTKLYEEMKDQPVPVDLNAIWKKLGVALDGDRVVYNPRAPLSAARVAITTAPGN